MTDAPKHTPGPWLVRAGQRAGPVFEIETINGLRVAITWTAPNAHQIAAAPEMFEALCDLYADAMELLGHDYPPDLRAKYPDMMRRHEADLANLERARAALAKARGGDAP